MFSAENKLSSSAVNLGKTNMVVIFYGSKAAQLYTFKDFALGSKNYSSNKGCLVFICNLLGKAYLIVRRAQTQETYKSGTAGMGLDILPQKRFLHTILPTFSIEKIILSVQGG